MYVDIVVLAVVVAVDGVVGATVVRVAEPEGDCRVGVAVVLAAGAVGPAETHAISDVEVTVGVKVEALRRGVVVVAGRAEAGIEDAETLG